MLTSIRQTASSRAGAPYRALPLNVLLQASMASLLLALIVMSGVAVWSIYSADRFLSRVHHSYNQLDLVHRIEADYYHYLLMQVGRSADASFGNTHDFSLESTEKKFEALTRSIQSEMDLETSPAKRAEIAEEFKTAQALRALFNGIPENIEHDRAASQPDDDAALRRFFSDVVGDSLNRLNKVVGEASFGEEAEAAAVMEQMAALRERLIASSAIIGGLTAIVALLVSLLVYQAIMRPVSALAAGAKEFGNGNLSHRVEVDSPPEFVALADRFNGMASDLDQQRGLLQRSHDVLEDTVRERTKDLEAKTQKLREIDENRRLFFSKTSHELRTPVTVLMGEAEVALRNKKGDAQSYREALTHIVASGGFLRRRLEDLIRLARSEDGKVTLERQPVDLSWCVRETVGAAEAYAHASEVSLVDDIKDGPLTISGDPSWVQQAILAVIDNAVKFSPPGGEVMIVVERAGTAGVVDISDSGPGVESEALANLFDPYFQASGGKRRGGSGLGLTVARWIVQQHGGNISARNITPSGLGIRLEFELDR